MTDRPSSVLTHSPKVDNKDTYFQSRKDLRGNTEDGPQYAAIKFIKSRFSRGLSQSEIDSIDIIIYERSAKLLAFHNEHLEEFNKLQRRVKKVLYKALDNPVFMDRIVKHIDKTLNKYYEQIS